ncbi:MAG: gliding motility-associated C-terminal domain-containing protein [Bacteroidota bacterium]
MKRLLLFSLLLSISFASKADHMMGSDIEYVCISPGKYKVLTKIYRQCKGIPLYFGNITVSCGANTYNVSVSRTSIKDITPTCSGGSNPCNPSNQMSNEGVEEHTFECIIDFNTAPYDNFKKDGCCEVYFAATQCCRDELITTQPYDNFYTESMVNICNVGKGCNNSPQLTTPPISYICCNQPFSFNNGVSDKVDGDSLVYTLADALKSKGSNILKNGSFTANIPMTPYCLPPGNVNCRPFPNAKPPRGFFFDNLTGDIIFTPANCKEAGPVVIQIDEFRKDSAGNWKHVGTTRRDMMMIVVKCAENNPPQITNTVNKFAVCEGNKICFTIKTVDNMAPNQTNPDTTYLSWNYGIPGASFRIVDPTAREKEAEFCWQTKIGDARTNSYSFTALVKDDNCPRPATTAKGFLINVKEKAQAKRQYDVLDCGKLRFNSFPKDTVNFKGTYTYEWTIRDSTNSGIIYKMSFSKKDSFKFKRGGKYIITHTITNMPINCPSVYTDTVIMPPVLAVELAFGKDTFACAGDSLRLKPIIAYGYAPFKFRWESPLGTHNPKDTLTTFGIKPTFNTSILLRITDKNKCVDQDTIKVKYQPLPVVNIGLDRRICTYQNVILDAQNDDTMRYYWQPDGDSTRLKTVNVAGKYFVKVIDHLGCYKTDTMQLFVNDTVVAIAKPDRQICIQDTLKVKAQRRPLGYSRQFVWTDLNTGIQMASDSSFKTKITQTTERKYDLYLKVTQGGVFCEDRDTLVITVNPLPTFKFAGIPPRCFTDGAVNLTQNNIALAMPGAHAVRYFQKFKNPSWVTGGPVGIAPYIYDYPKFISNAQVPNTGLRDTICYDYKDGNGCYFSECKPIRLNPNPDVKVIDGIFCQRAGKINLDKLVTVPFNKVGGIQSWRCLDVPQNSGVDPNSLVEEDNSVIPTKYYMDPGLEGENQKTGDYFLEYCFKNPTTSCQRCDTTRVTVVRLPEIQFDPIPSQCINYPLLVLDSFVLEKNSGKRFPSGTWKCVEYGNSRDMNNNLVNNAINNSIKNQKYFDPSTIQSGGQYLLKFTDVASGCIVMDSIIVNVNGLPKINLKLNQDTVCSSSAPVQLVSNYAINSPDGAWSGQFVTGDKFDPSLSPKAKQYEGVYTVRFTYTDPLTKCSDKDTHNIYIQSQPEVKIITAKPYQQCENDVFSPEATKSWATYTTWTRNGDGTIVSPKALKTDYKYGIQDTVAGNVIMTITTDKEGVCPPATDNVTLIFEPIPQFDLPLGYDACEPATIDFTSYVRKPFNSTNLRYSWDFGQGQSTSFSTNGNPTGIKYDTANRNGYNVKLTVYNQWGATQAEACPATIDSLNYVRIWPTPVVDFTSDPALFTTVAFPKFKFFNQTKAAFGPIKYYWNFGNTDPNDTTNESYEVNPIHIYPSDTMKYRVFLGAEYNYYDIRQATWMPCYDSISHPRVIGPDVTVFVPTAFSPEGTGPKTNNVFNAVVNGEKTFHIEVFNRWGELLWQSDNKYETWNGKFKDTDCQQDVYVWVVKVTAYDGEKYEYEGTVSLLR